MNRKQLKEVFTCLDVDKSGYIDHEEFLRGIKIVFKITDNLCDDLITDVFNFIDGFGLFNCRDRRLNKDELRKIWQSIPPNPEPTRESIAELLFNVIDSDNSGYIEISEFRRYLKKVEESKLRGCEIKQLFAKLSTECGKISKEKFVKYLCDSGITESE